MEDYDRVRSNTTQYVKADLDREMAERVRKYSGAGEEAITRRIAELDHEWGMERVLETNAAVFAFVGLALGILHNPYWLILPIVVLPFLFQHAVQGWCPPIPLFRRIGFRTRQEIDREKYALKLLRGDFDEASGTKKIEAVLNAVWM
jgi:hypothetical protein